MFLSPRQNWISHIFEWVFYFFIFTFPFINDRHFLYFGTTTRSINLILISSILGLLLGIFLLKKENEISIPRSPILLSVLVYFVSIFISALHGGDFQTSFYSNITRTTGLWYMLCLGIFLSLLINLFQDELKRRRVVILTIVSGAIFSILSLFGPEGFRFIFKTLENDGFTFGNSTFAGMYLFGSFILSLYFVFSEKTKSFWKLLIPIVLLVNPYILNIRGGEGSGILGFLGEARASGVAFFGAILALVIFFFISKIKNQKVKKQTAYGIFILTILVLVAGAFSLFSKEGVLRQFYLSQSNSARLLVWEVSDKLIAEKPILGWGGDNFEKTFELNYDSKALEEKYGNEPWFDRAHNVFIDQAFENGIVGLIFYILIYLVGALSLLYVIFNSKKEANIKFAAFLLVYIAFHLAELQTAFDTSISYIMLILMLAFATSIFKETLEENNLKYEYKINNIVKYTLAGATIIFCFWSLFFKTIPLIKSQIINGKLREVGSSEKRIPLYPALFNTPVDLQAIIWRTFTDFERGISQDPQVLENPKIFTSLKKELGIFEEEYKKYIETHPNNFRALLNYADAKIYFMLFGVNKLEEAQKILDQAHALVPQAPHPYWMKAVAYLYMQKFDLAKKTAKEGLDLNPEVKTSQEVVKYIDDSIKTFPDIDLYFFKQI